jgi:non-ribosomal peptide synthetase component F/acyl carrier protein
VTHLDVLHEVERRGLSLTVAGSDLKLQGPRQRVDADLVAQIRAAKPALIEYLTSAQAAREQSFGLTLLQRGYLIGRGDSIEIGNIASHVYHEYDGHWDVDRLESALRLVVARHGMLRTCFTEDGRQITLPQADVRIGRLDLTACPASEQRARLAELRAERSHRLLPTDRAPMIAVDVTLLSADQMRLHVSTDGLVLDGISMFMFFIDWHQAYAEGSLPAWNDVPFADYVAALETARSQAPARRSREYWLDRIDDLPPRPDLPLAANPATIANPRFTQYSASLGEPAWTALKARAASAGLTPTAVLMAAYAEALARWGAGHRFTLTTTVANRPPIRPNIASALGNFSSTLLVEIGVDQHQSFTEQAAALQARLRRDLDHRHFSGIEVLRELAQRGTVDPRMPYTFNSTIGYLREDVDGSAVELFGPETYTSSQTPQVWLNAFAFELHGGVVIQFDAVDGLFPDGLIPAMVAGYQSVLGRLAADDQAWSATTFDLLPADQQARRAAANATATEPDERLAYEGFLAQASRDPDAVAVLWSGGSLTYGQLAGQALRAARWLRDHDIGRDELTGLVLRRGPEQLIGILAAVLAGGAYLPVDASLPAERIRYMLRDGQVRQVLTNTGWTDETLPDVSTLELSTLDLSALETVEPEVAGTAVQDDRGTDWPPLPGASPDDLAYVLYTSGTTGEPKGVMISHRSVVNVVTDCNDRFGVGPSDRFIGISAFNFDLSVYDVFGALTAGAAVVLPDADRAADPAHWLELCDRFGVTIWNSVPAIAGLMAEQAAAQPGVTQPDVAGVAQPGMTQPDVAGVAQPGMTQPDVAGVAQPKVADVTQPGSADAARPGGAGAAGPLAALRLVMMSGDRIPPHLPTALWRVKPDLTLMSLGGPTETTVWNISHPIDRARADDDVIPYGRPNRNNRAYVLDAEGLDCPDWVTGEICAAGTGLARGYWADEARTAERFWFDPGRGERLFRTGDLGRYRPDGSIEIAGRSDFQIKVNGYRIEAGEVETRLTSIAAVKQAAVVKQAGARGDRLVAHLVPAGDARPSEAELRATLREYLPDYMTPSSVIWHDSLPLTRNGKVDRGRLITLIPAAGTTGSGTGPAETGWAAADLGGTGLAGADLAGAGLAGTGPAGTGLAGTGLAGADPAGTGLAGTGPAGRAGTGPAHAGPPPGSGTHPELEQALATLWSSVLRLPPASITPASDFYDLGGDSLAGARVFTGIRKQFGVSITLDRLYELRVLHVMAASVADGIPT